MANKLDNLRDWIITLGCLSSSVTSAEECGAKVEMYSQFLMMEFQPEDFCMKSLIYVAKKCRFFPSYGEICEHLHAWKDEYPDPNGPRRIPSTGMY